MVLIHIRMSMVIIPIKLFQGNTRDSSADQGAIEQGSEVAIKSEFLTDQENDILRQRAGRHYYHVWRLRRNWEIMKAKFTRIGEAER